VTLRARFKDEVVIASLTALYFGAWFVMLVVFKSLVLAEYGIGSTGLAVAAISALIVTKVVLVLEHVRFGAWVERRPAVVDVLLRTLFYGLAVLLVLLLETAFDARHEKGGFLSSLQQVLHHGDIHHVWADTLAVSGALLGFNAFSLVRRHLGKGGLLRAFLSPLPAHWKEEARDNQTATRPCRDA